MSVIQFKMTAPPPSEGERIRALATYIRTQAQYDAILADCAPELREDVKNMLDPLVHLDPLVTLE